MIDARTLLQDNHDGSEGCITTVDYVAVPALGRLYAESSPAAIGRTAMILVCYVLSEIAFAPVVLGTTPRLYWCSDGLMSIATAVALIFSLSLIHI